MNNTLHELQRQFQAYVHDGQPVFVPQIVGDERAGAEERLNVYYQAYRLRALEVLGNDFPGLRSLMDEDEFRDVCLAYLRWHPPAQPSIRWLGAELATFLAVDDGSRQRVELTEMAAYEWSRAAVFDAPDSPVLEPAALETLPPERWAVLTLAFQPAVALLRLQTNVANVHRAVLRQEAAVAVEVNAQPVDILLWRHDYRIYWRSLDADEAWAIAACRDGEDFGTLCDGLCRWHEAGEVPARAAILLKQWLAAGLIENFDRDQTPTPELGDEL